MEAAAVLAAGLEDWVDFGVICALLLLNAAVGFIQEYQAGSIVDELKKTLALKAVVLRDGTLKEVEAPQVVPGDILQVEEVSNISTQSNASQPANLVFYRVPLSPLMAELSPTMPSSRLISLPSLVNLSPSTSTRVINVSLPPLSSVVRLSLSLLPLEITPSLVVPPPLSTRPLVVLVTSLKSLTALVLFCLSSSSSLS